MNDTREPLADSLGRIFAREQGVLAAYLFGSHAAGRAHRDSDIDVGVLLDWTRYPSSRDRFEQRLRLSARLAGHAGRAGADIVILNDAPPQLARHIITTGRRVFSVDPQADHDFRRTMLLLAADLEPFLRRTRRVKLAALAR